MISRTSNSLKHQSLSLSFQTVTISFDLILFGLFSVANSFFNAFHMALRWFCFIFSIKFDFYEDLWIENANFITQKPLQMGATHLNESLEWQNVRKKTAVLEGSVLALVALFQSSLML